MRMPSVKLRLFLALALCAFPAAAQIAIVVDGETLKVAGTTYRLWGIDAELHQACADGWPSGIEAKSALTEMVRDHAIRCDPKTYDKYGRTVAICWADDVDLSKAMVLAGAAVASLKYGRDYVEQEMLARASRRGVHGHDCVKPWGYRAQRGRQ